MILHWKFCCNLVTQQCKTIFGWNKIMINQLMILFVQFAVESHCLKQCLHFVKTAFVCSVSRILIWDLRVSVILKWFMCTVLKSVNKADRGDKWMDQNLNLCCRCGVLTLAERQSWFEFEKIPVRCATQPSNSVNTTLVIYLRSPNKLLRTDAAAVVALGALCNCWHGLCPHPHPR